MQTVLLQAAPAAPTPGGGGIEMIVLIAGLVGIMYFMMIRPQQKRAKKEKQFRASIKEGDKVVTIGGMHGKVDRVDGDTIIVVADNSKLRFDRSAIARYSDDAPPAAK
jgi:preprotein translocase subunit YajC